MSAPTRAKALAGLCAGLVLILSAGAASCAPAGGFGLLRELARRPFVTLDAKGAPVPLAFTPVGDDRIEIWIAGQLAEIYSLEDQGAGRRLNPAAPDLGDPATYDEAGWTVASPGGVVRFGLAPDGAVIGRRGDDAEPALRKRFHLAFPPTAPDLTGRLRQERLEIIDEAMRVDGHHAHPHH